MTKSCYVPFNTFFAVSHQLLCIAPIKKKKNKRIKTSIIAFKVQKIFIINKRNLFKFLSERTSSGTLRFYDFFSTFKEILYRLIHWFFLYFYSFILLFEYFFSLSFF